MIVRRDAQKLAEETKSAKAKLYVRWALAQDDDVAPDLHLSPGCGEISAGSPFSHQQTCSVPLQGNLTCNSLTL